MVAKAPPLPEKLKWADLVLPDHLPKGQPVPNAALSRQYEDMRGQNLSPLRSLLMDIHVHWFITLDCGCARDVLINIT
jgi:hypothetical protein